MTKILVIGENKCDFISVRRVLEKEKYRTFYAPSGQRGIELVKKSRPDCILLDQEMPVMNGIETCRKLKENKKNAHIPVILWIAADTQQDILQGIEAGADDFVNKSDDYAFLLVRIKTMFRIRQLYGQLETALSYSRKVVYFSKNINTIRMGELIEALKENLEEIFEVQTFSLFLYDKSSDSLKLTAHNQESLKNKNITINRNENSIMWESVNRKRPFVMGNLEDSPYFSGVKLHHDNFTILHPLIVGEEIIGVVSMNNSQCGKLPEELLANSTTAIEHLASAIANCNAYQKMEELSTIDELTQLSNKRRLYIELDKELSRAKRYDRNLSFTMIDIDNFKSINDEHGHLYGDFVLRKLASILVSCRKSDRVFRFGGEEFFIILPETSRKNALIAAERIRILVKEHAFKYHEISTHLTVSLGVAFYPDDNINTTEYAVKLADQRLYKAKEFGKDQVFANFTNKKT
ncbi:diguanylate cyclase [Candidatus Pacearchaeota archaeon]|nr:diguanylate cyclase [Candidatus Pacearchaeota archaeon]